MSVHMKKHPTKDELILKDKIGRVYLLPKKVASKYILSKNKLNSISAEEFFSPYEKKYTKPGMLLRGLRIREGLTQTEFSKLIKVTQANLSHMENGKRPIGKMLSQRIAKVFKIDYRMFL